MKTTILGVMFLIFMVNFNVGYAKHKYSERKYQISWCDEKKGKTEYMLEDRTRVDCLTRNLAVEVEFAEKWHQAIGQALFYAEMTNRIPAIVLILEDEKEKRFLVRLLTATAKTNIRIYVIHNY